MVVKRIGAFHKYEVINHLSSQRYLFAYRICTLLVIRNAVSTPTQGAQFVTFLVEAPHLIRTHRRTCHTLTLSQPLITVQASFNMKKRFDVAPVEAYSDYTEVSSSTPMAYSTRVRVHTRDAPTSLQHKTMHILRE